MKYKLGTGFVAIALASLAFGVFDGLTIKIVPKVGEVHKYKQSAKFDVGGTDFEYSAISTRKVVKADPDGSYAIKEDVSEIKFNGQDAPPGQGQGNTTVTYSAKGEVVKIEGEGVDDNLYRFSNLTIFIVPDKALNPGDSWTYQVKGNKSTGAVEAKASYTFVGEEKVGTTDALKFKYSIKEIGDAGAGSEGTLWLNKSDDSMLKVAAKWLNAPVPGGATVSGDITVTLIQ